MMSPDLYPRKVGTWVDKRPKPYVLSWADGTCVLAFVEESSAINYARILTQQYGSKVTMTGPEHEYHACGCGCGRVFRDGEGVRIGQVVYAPYCPEYGAHPAVVGETMAGILADERQDTFNRTRR